MLHSHFYSNIEFVRDAVLLTDFVLLPWSALDLIGTVLALALPLSVGQRCSDFCAEPNTVTICMIGAAVDSNPTAGAGAT
jgi:hypothetical protein